MYVWGGGYKLPIIYCVDFTSKNPTLHGRVIASSADKLFSAEIPSFIKCNRPPGNLSQESAAPKMADVKQIIMIQTMTLK